MKNSANKVEMQSYDDLFGTNASHENGKIIEVDIGQLHDFKRHPFQVRDDEEMLELVESVKTRGVLVPGIVRLHKDSGYEIISGHRRKHASVLAGKEKMPVICQELSDDDATVVMVESNIQRENLLPSEKAMAYRMKMDALKHQGRRGTNTTQEIGEKTGDNERTVQRYIRLTYLIPELLEAIDQKKMALIAGSDLSFLTMEEQKWLLDIIHEYRKYPNGIVAGQLKEYSKNKELNRALIRVLLMGKGKESFKVIIKDDKIQEYFPTNYGKEEIEKVIFSLLDEWKAKNE